MSHFGLHLQTPVSEWDSEILWAAENGKPYKVVKAFWVEAGTTVKHLSPQTDTVFRQFVVHQQPFLDRAIISPEEGDGAADQFIRMFKDSVNQHGNVDYVESLNETYASKNLLNQQKAVAFDRAFIRRLKVHCPATRPIVYNAASGNIDHDEYAVLVDLARECEAADGAFGYHNYWSVVHGISYAGSREHAMDYQMRWAWSLDKYLVDRGIRVKHMLGESGPIGAGPNGYWQLPEDGWLMHSVWNGNIDGYISDLEVVDSLFYDSVPGREGRIIGAPLFTSGYGIGWDAFQVQFALLGRLTDHIINYDAGTPPPPPLDNFKKEAWRITAEMQRTGQNGIRLNADAAIQLEIDYDNLTEGTDFQIVTSETGVDGRTVQAAESHSGVFPRRVYVWELGEEIYWYENP
jgi:hypothetical protein